MDYWPNRGLVFPNLCPLAFAFVYSRRSLFSSKAKQRVRRTSDEEVEEVKDKQEREAPELMSEAFSHSARASQGPRERLAIGIVL